MLEWFKYIARFIRGWFSSRQSLVVENLALRSQLALFEHQVISGKRKKPKATLAFRQLWTVLSRCCTGWESVLVVFKPDTIIRWHDRAFRLYWRCKSKPRGRPALSKDIIDTIKQIHELNPLWSPERIHDQLVSLGFTGVPCAKTIAKYIPDIRKPPSEKARQSWRTFLANHKQDIWAMDFMTVPTLTFKVLYVLVIIGHERREIKHIAITEHPTADWTIQQLREATPFGEHPKYLIHDNGSVFRSQDVQSFLDAIGIKSVRTGYRRPDQNGVCERFLGILRRELIDHINTIRRTAPLQTAERIHRQVLPLCPNSQQPESQAANHNRSCWDITAVMQCSVSTSINPWRSLPPIRNKSRLTDIGIVECPRTAQPTERQHRCVCFSLKAYS